MAERRDMPASGEGGTAAGPSASRRSAEAVSWTQAWQLPVLLAGLALTGIGIMLAMPERAPNDVPGAIDEAERLIELNQLDDAEQKLTEVQAALDEATPTDHGRALQAWGDLKYLRLQKQLRVAGPTAVHEQIAGFYARAQQKLGELGDTAQRRYARTLVGLGREDEALTLVDAMEGEPAARYTIIRDMIELRREGGDRGSPTLLELVGRYKSELGEETDAAARRAGSVWVYGLEAQLRIEAGDPQGAIDLLVQQRLPALIGRTEDLAAARGDFAPLYVKLAQAYREAGEADQAEAYFLQAQQHLSAGDPLQADVLVGLGWIELARGGEEAVRRAYELFSQADREYPDEPAHVEALIGRADCEARLGAYPEAIEHVALAVSALGESREVEDRRREALLGMVRTHVAGLVNQQQYEQALELMRTLLPLYGQEPPPALLLALAETHELQAEADRAEARRIEQWLEQGRPDATVEAMRHANQRASLHYEKAGDDYLRHAQAVTISDDEAHGRSLWRAGAAYDRAQLWSKAAGVYSEFIKTRGHDPMRLGAMHRLGKAYLADGQYEAALDLFLELIDKHPHAPESYDSLVPLARAYMALGRYDEARRGLESVVTDHPAITPESAEYREALIELGRMFHRLGEQDPRHYWSAIERLTFAVERYPDELERGAELRFLLADSYRKSVTMLDERLEDSPTDTERLRLQQQRRDHLEKAMMYYTQAIELLDDRPVATLSSLEKIYHRNAYFYRSDCAYDLAQYERAIELYLTAAQRFEDDPSALVAMIQIVNAHASLGQYQEARAANQNARWLLDRLPDEAFDDPSLPMSRKHWEDWLRWTSELEVFADGTPAAAP